MSVIDFWNAMHEGGDVVVDQPERDGGTVSSDKDLEQAIRSIESDWRLELAYAPPALIVPVATWAATLMYRAAQCLVYPQIDAKGIEKLLARPCPAAPSEDACYSADLALRALPALLSLSRRVAVDDPLVLELKKLAHHWPLSSVGVTDLRDLDVSPFIGHRSLRRLYADRIIERGDASRLNDPRVAEAVRDALGGHGDDLAPNLARHLRDLNGPAK